MQRISYLNSEYLPHEKCFVHIEDRGFQLADGVYEVILFANNKLIDFDGHITRLFRSLNEVKINHNFSKDLIKELMLNLFKKNNMSEGTCYIQITRGAANRVPYLPANLTPTICATVSPKKEMSEEEFKNGFTVMTNDDIRWHRCDIKTTALLASSMLNQKAKDLGYNDVIFIRSGVVTESSYANLFFIDQDDNLITKLADNLILRGITRDRFIEIAKNNNINVIEKNFNLEELLKAKEVFLTSSSLILRPVVKIDKTLISNEAGPIAKKLYKLYQEFIKN